LKPARFRYVRPASLDEAVDLLAEHGSDAALLAGGQSLVPLMNQRLRCPAALIDVNFVGELNGRDEGEASVVIGALVRQRELESDGAVGRAEPLFAEASLFVGNRQVRNRGTLVGSLAFADPAAEYPGVLVALGATATALSPRGEREISCENVATGAFSCSLAADELITSVRVPKALAGRGSAYTEIAERRGARALAGAAAVVELGRDGSVSSCRVVLVGVADVPLQVDGLDRLGGQPIPTDEEIRGLLTAWSLPIPVRPDRRADPRYKRTVAAEVGITALRRAASRARHLAGCS
jgi:aerobic carbon-monoxide dehydrogenase medium subunit